MEVRCLKVIVTCLSSLSLWEKLVSIIWGCVVFSRPALGMRWYFFQRLCATRFTKSTCRRHGSSLLATDVLPFLGGQIAPFSSGCFQDWCCRCCHGKTREPITAGMELLSVNMPRGPDPLSETANNQWVVCDPRNLWPTSKVCFAQSSGKVANKDVTTTFLATSHKLHHISTSAISVGLNDKQYLVDHTCPWQSVVKQTLPTPTFTTSVQWKCDLISQLWHTSVTPNHIF